MILTNILRRLLRRSFQRAPDRHLKAWLQQGYSYEREGKHAQAQALFERALKAAPANVDAHYLLGSLLGKNGDLAPAAVHLERAIAGKVDFAEAYAALGNVRLLQDDKPAALASYKQAVRLDPSSAAVHSNLGLLYQSCGKHTAALQEFQSAHRLGFDSRDLLTSLILAYIELEKFDAALAFLDPILLIQPQHAEALKCKGFILQKMHKPDQALGYYQRARALKANDPEMLNNFGIVLQDLGRLEPAIECYDAAIALKPDFPLAIWHRSLAYLLQHDFARGWPDYELRTISIDQPLPPQHFPQWEGESLAGRGILVYAEQGLGDEIMFASCLPDLIAASKHCLIECSPKLERLFRRSFSAATVYATTPSRDLPPGARETGIELQTAIGSVPRHLRRSYAEFPVHSGYLQADPERIRLWRERLFQLGTGLKVGISWQGGTLKSRRQTRSLPLEQWLPIFRTPGVRFVNLQYSECSVELTQLETEAAIKINDWPEVRDDYENTAALVAALDLVISVCTAVIHLSGALGKPVWIMAPYSPEWRYGIAGEKMPWYPSARVFRQPSYGLWKPVIDQVARELMVAASDRSGQLP